MRKAYKIDNLLTGSVFEIYATLDNVQHTIISSADSTFYMKESFSGFLFMSNYSDFLTKEQNIASAKLMFEQAFTLFLSSNQENINRMYRAIIAEYDPLENYDRKEDGGWTDAHHKGTRTSRAIKETTTPNLTTETVETPNRSTETIETPNRSTETVDTPRTTVEAKDYQYGFNSVEETPVNRSETKATDGQNTTTVTESGSNTTTVTESGSNSTTVTESGSNTREANADSNYEETRDISNTVYDNDKHTFDAYRVHGNVGVTKTQDMIASEIELRKNSLAMILLDEFVYKYCFYSSTIEGV